MVVILLGPPGVGKGTQAVRLADSVGWEHVSTGDLLRAARRAGSELGKKAQAFMDAGELVPDSLILDLVRDHLKGIPPEAGILLDGFPRTTAQAEGLDGVLAAVGRRVDRVVVFEASDEELIQRLSGRRSCPECGAVFNVHFTPPKSEGKCDRCGAALVHRADDKAETVKNRLKVYAAQTQPLIEWYGRSGAAVVSVGAEAPVDDVQREFRKAVGQ
ncbi:MAG TPA: adenylate kinase [Longimicrobiales bacterium]|nr:adenylate kinase [Longimicrobiales bacterium]